MRYVAVQRTRLALPKRMFLLLPCNRRNISPYIFLPLSLILYLFRTFVSCNREEMCRNWHTWPRSHKQKPNHSKKPNHSEEPPEPATAAGKTAKVENTGRSAAKILASPPTSLKSKRSRPPVWHGTAHMPSQPHFSTCHSPCERSCIPINDELHGRIATEPMWFLQNAHAHRMHSFWLFSHRPLHG